MTFDAKQFLDTYSIPWTNQGKNTSADFINIDCPFCPGGDTGNHFGFNLSSNYCHCWKCGKKKIIDVIQVLLDVSFSEALRIKNEFSSDFITESLNKDKIKSNKSVLKLPKFCLPLEKKHKKYLEKRNFDAEYLENKYNLKGTLHFAQYKDYGDYNFRIIIPIYLNKKLISFQGRDITGKQNLRYKTCPKEEEVKFHKYSLFNIDNCKRDKAVVVEGIFDVFRLGENSVCTFGINWNMMQIKMISKKFKEVFILFDNEIEAQKKAHKMAYTLSSLNIKTEIITLENIKDPGELKQEEADNLMREVIG